MLNRVLLSLEKERVTDECELADSLWSDDCREAESVKERVMEEKERGELPPRCLEEGVRDSGEIPLGRRVTDREIPIEFDFDLEVV